MRRLLLAVGVAAVAVALLLFYLAGRGAVEQLVGGSFWGRRVLYTLKLEVEGGGRLLVNGTSASVVNSTKPFTAVIEAVAEPCYTLKQLLVNGTPVEGARVELSVKGNTTVKAVFEQLLRMVLIEGNVTGASAEVNGALYNLPALLTVRACEVLTVTPVSPPRYYALNGTLTLNVTGDLRLKLYFKRWLITLQLRNLFYPARVNRELYNASADIELAYGSRVDVELVDAKCRLHNDTHLICPAGWLAKLLDWSANGTDTLELPSKFTLTLKGDTLLEQRVSYLRLPDPIVRLSIKTPDGVFQAKVIPGSRWIGEYIARHFSGKVEVTPDGWLKLEGYRVTAFIELPKNWGKVRVYARRVYPISGAGSDIEVIVRNDQIFYAPGISLPPKCFTRGAGYSEIESYTVFTIDSGILNLERREMCEHMKHFNIESLWCSHEPDCCYVGCSIIGPGSRRFEDVEVGWLHAFAEGWLLLKIEVIEWKK